MRPAEILAAAPSFVVPGHRNSCCSSIRCLHRPPKLHSLVSVSVISYPSPTWSLVGFSLPASSPASPSPVRRISSELCKDMFMQWSNLDDSHFLVEKISGGITNLLLKVTVIEENGSDVSVTIRLYGSNTDYVINREREMIATRCLSAAGIGAKALATFENGMMQSFINAQTM